jgi:chromosomal replication initiator protein
VATPGKHTVDDVSAFLKVSPQQLVKTLLFKSHDRVIAALVPGDRALNEVKFAKVVPDAQVLTFIAGRVSTNIRELEGALTRVVAFSSLTGRPMTVELAQEVLEDVFPQGEPPEISIERIQEIVSQRFGISMQELLGQRRSRAVVYPRHVAMYLCRKHTETSFPTIGDKFGGRDHSTVIHASKTIERKIKEDPYMQTTIEKLERTLNVKK